MPVTGLDGLGSASYGIVAENGGKQMSTGHLHQMGSSPFPTKNKSHSECIIHYGIYCIFTHLMIQGCKENDLIIKKPHAPFVSFYKHPLFFRNIVLY